ncbi:hypothetical protein CHK_1903 [Christensenella hongkongensis]|uniref:Uncharacterized protein n=1 Tax=Christensenella hongkongensis TaxID=270498 RepID=A0A0M2NDK8_9FIRM|nr:hypothetical protein CHK_1903 [Christensenella hongkongensis]
MAKEAPSRSGLKRIDRNFAKQSRPDLSGGAFLTDSVDIGRQK